MLFGFDLGSHVILITNAALSQERTLVLACRDGDLDTVRWLVSEGEVVASEVVDVYWSEVRCCVRCSEVHHWVTASLACCAVARAAARMQGRASRHRSVPCDRSWRRCSDCAGPGSSSPLLDVVDWLGWCLIVVCGDQDSSEYPRSTALLIACERWHWDIARWLVYEGGSDPTSECDLVSPP
jgi:hypothetical protein